MASRILHLAVAEKIIERIPIQEYGRFRLGSLLPDAYRTGVSKTDSHFKIHICGGSKKTYDLQRFQDTFGDRLKTDALYLGYYLHLIQDLIFRRLVYEKHRWNPRIPGNVERLHEDYKQLNPYVITHYGLKNCLELPEDFFDEKINTVYPFDIHTLRSDLNHDFEWETDQQEYTAFFFTPEMSVEFISKAVEVCIAEINALRVGKHGVRSYDYVWWDLCPSLLKTTQNTRDLGGYPTRDGGMTKRNSLIRSDVQRYPSEEDITFLKSHGITTVIDMRSEKDVAKKTSGFAEVEGFQYRHCPISEGGGVPESVEAVPTTYLSIACAANMSQVFRTIAHAEGGVMFNCSAGKDRTGVVSAILLSHAGVSDEDVIENYVLTKEYGKERLALVHQNFPDVDMNIVIPQEGFMREFLKLFRERFQNTDCYFKEIGLNEQEIAGITEKCVSAQNSDIGYKYCSS